MVDGLQCGRAPGEFLVFIKSTTRYQESQVSLTVSHQLDIYLGGVWTCVNTYSLIIAAQVVFFGC